MQSDRRPRRSRTKVTDERYLRPVSVSTLRKDGFDGVGHRLSANQRSHLDDRVPAVVHDRGGAAGLKRAPQYLACQSCAFVIGRLAVMVF